MKSDKVKNNYFYKNLINIIVFAVYLTFVIVGVLHHENFRDEAQAWLIARDLDLAGIIKQMQYEGHFVLWYLILIPFAKLGFPYFTMNIISAVLTSIAAYLVLFKSPLPAYIKYPSVFVSSFIYSFPAISRCYSIIPIALTLICIFRSKRHEKPGPYILSIVLLANSHVFMWGLVAALFAEYFIEILFSFYKEKKFSFNKQLVWLFTGGILLIISALPLLTSLGTNIEAGSEVIPVSAEYYMLLKQSVGDLLVDAFFIIIPLVIIVCAFISFRETLLFTASFLYQLVLSSKVFPINSQRSGIWVITIIFLIWMYFDNKKNNSIQPPKYIKTVKLVSLVCVISIILVNAVYGFGLLFFDVKSNYSSAFDTAQFIDTQLEPDAVIIVSNHPEIATALLPYFGSDSDIRLYNYASGEYYTYHTWDEYTYICIDDNFINNIRDVIKDNDHVYYLAPRLNEYYQDDEGRDYDLVSEYEAEEILVRIHQSSIASVESDESYVLYKVNI